MSAMKNLISVSMSVVAKEASLSAESLTWLEASTIALKLADEIGGPTGDANAKLMVVSALAVISRNFTARHEQAQALLNRSRADMPTQIEAAQ